MTETLYKTRAPQVTDFRDQHYELSMGEQTGKGQPGYFVRETHCWWDARAKQIVRVQYTLSPRHGFMTIEEAYACYHSRRMDRARRGFVHSFSPRYEPMKRNQYLRIEIPVESKE